MVVTNFNPVVNVTTAHRKEKFFKESYEVIRYNTDGTFSNPISLRFYKTNTNRYYACLWVFGVATGSGADNPKGYNYNKQAEAAKRAFQSAGIEFDTSIESYGHFEPALRAIAARIGIVEPFTVFNAAG